MSDARHETGSTTEEGCLKPLPIDECVESANSSDVPGGDSEDAGTSKGRPKKRPREAKPLKTVASVLDAVVAPPPDFETLKNLLRKTNRSYQEAFGEGFASALENATETHQLMDYYHTYCNAKAAEIMGKCLLFYKQAHNFVYTASDEKIIARAAARPVKSDLGQVRKLFDHYLRDLEQVHHYFAKGRPRTEMTKRAMLPYNAFVKDQWNLRAQEFGQIPTNERFATVNKILTAEWKLPETKHKYMCDKNLTS
jgi:hypothetical protein